MMKPRRRGMPYLPGLIRGEGRVVRRFLSPEYVFYMNGTSIIWEGVRIIIGGDRNLSLIKLLLD